MATENDVLDEMLLGLDTAPNNQDEFDDLLDFKDTIDFNDSPLFDDSWNLQNTPPYDTDGLYSTPLSWNIPQTQMPMPVQQTQVQRLYAPASSTLTAAQQEQLRNIAMPNHAQLQNPSPQSLSSTYKSGSVSSPEQSSSRKRKNSDDEEDEEEEGEGGKHPPVKKTAHNMIEKRYRTNLNDKIAALRDSVPSLRVMSKTARGEDTTADKEELQGLTPAHKLNKATVLAKATEYIRHLEKRNKRLTDDNTAMKARISAFEKLFMSGSMGVSSGQSNATPNMNSFVQEPFMTTSDGMITPDVSPSGMIDVPDDFRRLHASSQLDTQTYPVPEQSYQPTYRQQRGNGGANGWPNAGWVGKMMVGSLAGLMVMEGFSEAEQGPENPGARGLFAVPTQLIHFASRYLQTHTEISVLGYHSSSQQTLTFLRLGLLVGTLLYVFLPSLFIQQPKPSGKLGGSSGVLAPAPAPASSIQVRRQAWLTAVQTVWNPGHNFYFEAARLGSKMLKLSFRNAIGWYGYSLLTGSTEQEEAARVKAWGIALDAQLAGGDVEVSKGRLILTLIASGTLPDTPVRLMLKSIHVRILLWEFGNCGFNGFYMFQEFAGKLARWKWNEAKKLQKLLLAHADSRPQGYEPLPDHLVTLLEQECDDVLVDAIGQRAYNLCWNKPTTYNLLAPSDGMDGVVVDFAVSSPLDAVAAWWSSLMLQRAFAASLAGEEAASVLAKIDFASATAPIGSGVQLRALVARAVLVDDQRGANIATAMQLLQPASPVSSSAAEGDVSLINTTTSTASLPDLPIALSCAKVLAHLSRTPASPPSSILPILTSLSKSLRGAASDLSLLGFSAAYKVMNAVCANEAARLACERQLESVAGCLRIWVGGAKALETGLGREVREGVVERCVDVVRGCVGMVEVRGGDVARDEGFESMSEQEEGEKC